MENGQKQCMGQRLLERGENILIVGGIALDAEKLVVTCFDGLGGVLALAPARGLLGAHGWQVGGTAKLVYKVKRLLSVFAGRRRGLDSGNS